MCSCWNYDQKTTVNIPETIEFRDRVFSIIGLETGCFAAYKNLQSVTLPNTIKEIPERCFTICMEL